METPKIYTCVVVDLVHNIDKLAPVWERVNTNMSSKDEDIVRLGLECGCVSGGFFSPLLPVSSAAHRRSISAAHAALISVISSSPTGSSEPRSA